MWMKKAKKAILALSVFCLTGGSALAVTPAEQTYLDAVNYMGSHPEGAYTWQYKATMPFFGDAVLHADQYVKTEPLQSRLDVWGSVAAMDKQMDKVSAYLEQDGASLALYYPQEEKGKTQWHKAVFPLKDATPLVEIIRKQTHTGALNGVQSVTAGADDTYSVVYDMSRVYTPGDEAQWKKQGVTKKEDIELLRDILLSLKNSGDLTVQMTIDKTANRITRVQVPLTPQVRAVADRILAEAEKKAPERKAEIAMIRQFANSSTVTADGAWQELPQNIDLTVPQRVKEKAVPDKDIKTAVSTSEGQEK